MKLDISKITEKELLPITGMLEDEYYDAIHYIQKKTSVIYKRKPSEVKIGPFSSIILKLLKSKTNLQFATGIHAMLTYLTSYLRNSASQSSSYMSELIKKASKEEYGSSLRKNCLQ